MITFALPKGRLMGPILRALGPYAPDTEALDTRALVVPGRGVRFLLLKPPDVPAYVERGVAQLGVVGLDLLREEPADVLEPLALTLGRCRLCLCSRPGVDLAARVRQGRLRIGTRYPRLAGIELGRRGLVADIIPLHGSVELAVVTQLADAIVDLVETGETLRANGLVVRDELMDISARVVVNRAAFALDMGRLAPMLRTLEETCGA